MLQITDNGIIIDSFDTIYERLVGKFKSIYGQDVNLDSDTPDGQLLGLLTQELELVHQSVSFIAQMLDPYQATGKWLEQRALYAGLLRNTASYSYIDEVIITGEPKTLIPINSILIDKNKNQWLITEQLTLNELGSAKTKIRSKLLGEFNLKKGEELELVTVILGIDKVLANSDAYGGADEETDSQLLKRFMLSHSINNYDERQGIQSALRAITGVTKCVVYENYTNQTDEKGVPAHSFNAVLLGGDDNDIAEVITKKKIGGCGLFGKQETYYKHEGYDRKVLFDRPTRKEVEVKMVLGRFENFTDINKEQIEKNLLNTDFNIHENVYATRIISSINLVDGFYIKELTVNGAQIVNVDYREYAEITKVEVLVDG